MISEPHHDHNESLLFVDDRNEEGYKKNQSEPTLDTADIRPINVNLLEFNSNLKQIPGEELKVKPCSYPMFYRAGI